jgi:peptidyl-prolyl cis-trans isomerase A (cyclophilin A)
MKNVSRLLLLVVFASSSAFAASSPTQAPDHFSFAFETTQGEIQFDCPQGWSPLGAQRIYDLINAKFFTDVAFFRVIECFVAQFGISGDPATTAKWADTAIKDEPVVGSNVAGTLTFADAGPNTRTTQLFINLVDNPRLDPLGFSPVCKVSNATGLNVAKKLYSAYGEGAPGGSGPDQDLITQQGNAYLKANFPKLDYVQSAVLK